MAFGHVGCCLASPLAVSRPRRLDLQNFPASLIVPREHLFADQLPTGLRMLRRAVHPERCGGYSTDHSKSMRSDHRSHRWRTRAYQTLLPEFCSFSVARRSWQNESFFCACRTMVARRLAVGRPSGNFRVGKSNRGTEIRTVLASRPYTRAWSFIVLIPCWYFASALVACSISSQKGAKVPSANSSSALFR